MRILSGEDHLLWTRSDGLQGTQEKVHAVNNLKQTLMEQWSLIQNQPLLKTIYLKHPIISYKRDKSLKDTLVRSKI